ncbi:LysR family transcriptional regulator [Agrobacterium tumefaciens]|uniref:HTH-type transcriptional regulator TtuA n=1 Tax=Agrobacterium tumefaciens TaxID=358 RepID=A0AAP9J7N4_AGRTU|nr:LysR family transcriptional regulator [Agrobacterium tumefaciens]QDY95457.1 LysR family transcriptional regulator [Agrobacterium tumefaciens]UXS50550.1 LysR family transcriptional regulator [Agrobacterium tumefaciens]UXS71793.1 LysR family transcriptional regulator [Agrobacterium tumefaciens]UXS79460.1 LysR family transcriptional regulator [Agrobacterium tumefaciens]
MTSLIQALAVAEHLNFRHAAAALGVTQSSVSTRIKLLEQELGILLFERRHRGVKLTQAGSHFVAEIAAGIELLDRAVKSVGAISNGTAGRLAIGLHASIAAGFITDLRRAYRLAHPLIEQTVVEGRSAETIVQVREGRLDLAFVLGNVNAPDCHSRHLWNERLMIALPEHHVLAGSQSTEWRALVSEVFLVMQGGVGPQMFEHIVRRIAERQFSPQVRQFDVGRDTLLHMVAEGDGIALTTEASTSVPFPGVVFRNISDEPELARFSAVWSPHNRSPALKNLLDLATGMSRSAR